MQSEPGSVRNKGRRHAVALALVFTMGHVLNPVYAAKLTLEQNRNIMQSYLMEETHGPRRHLRYRRTRLTGRLPHGHRDLCASSGRDGVTRSSHRRHCERSEAIQTRAGAEGSYGCDRRSQRVACVPRLLRSARSDGAPTQPCALWLQFAFAAPRFPRYWRDQKGTWP